MGMNQWNFYGHILSKGKGDPISQKSMQLRITIVEIYISVEGGINEKQMDDCAYFGISIPCFSYCYRYK